MYIIIDKTGIIVCITTAITYVTRENGRPIAVDLKKATAVYAADNDTFYPLIPPDWAQDNYCVVEIESVPDEVVPNSWRYAEGEFTPTEPTMTTEEAILDKLTELEYRQDLVELGLGGGAAI